MKTLLSTSLLLLATSVAAVRADDWPQWMGPNRDGILKETGLVEKFAADGPKVLWRMPISGGYAGPAVAAGRVFVTDYVASEGKDNASFAGRDKRKGTERIHCLDAKTGKQLWKYEYPCAYSISYSSGPRATPTVDGGRVYCLGAQGNLFCLDVETGKVVWQKDFPQDYKAEVPLWGFCGHPLIDGNKLICLVGGQGSVAVAFDKLTGRELWKALDAKDPGYCPPSIIEAGGVRQLILWHSEAINGLDPETGKVYWTEPLAPLYAMSIATPRKDGDILYAGGMGFIGAAFKLASDKPTVEVLWKGTKTGAIYPSNVTPLAVDGTLYGCDGMDGSLRAVSLKDGKILWTTFAATAGKRTNHGSAFLVKNGDRFFLMSETGHLIIAKLSPEKYEEVSRAKILEPTSVTFGRDYVWSHPAFADKCMFARNDKEIVCVSLAK